MKYSFTALVFCLSAMLTNGQVKNQDALRQKIKDQAAKMGDAFISGNYSSFAKYTYPKLVTLIGGQKKMADVLTKTTDDMKAQGMTFSKVSFGEPTDILKAGNELQCIVPQQLEIKLRRGRVVANSSLIAISSDNGNNWTFVDTSNKDLATIKKILPNLNSSIVIPPPQQPVKYDD